MKNKFSKSALLTAMLFSVNAFAADEPTTNAWDASAELGYVSTSGNTTTETLNAKANASTEVDKWKHTFELTALNSSSGATTTSERYTLSGQSDYKLTKPNFLYGLVNYENDKFAQYDYQTTEAFGYGRRVIEEKDLKLDLEVGPGARQSKLSTGSSVNETFIRLAGKLKWNISETSKFSESLVIESGEDTDVIKSVTSLSTKIDSDLSMKVSYTYKNTSPSTIKETDTETAITLVYTF